MTLVAILDDRSSNRQIYARLAQAISDDVSAWSFDDPIEALHWAAGNFPDLVITDYKMPALDGGEFTRRLRQLPGCDDVPVLVITAYDDRSFRLAALEAGATDFLRSPVDHAEFITRARNMLRMYHQHRLLQSRAVQLEHDLQNSERSREKLLRDSRESLAQVIDTVPAFISATDRTGRYVLVNAMHARLAPISHGSLIGQDAGRVFGSTYEDRNRSLDQMVFRTGSTLPGYEEEVVDDSGARRILLTTKAPLKDGDDNIDCVLTTSLDITERKQAERRLKHMADHDWLTGLPNRSLLREALSRRLGSAPHSEASVALHFVDLGQFKSVNDRLGHQQGDLLLKEVARRLSASVTPEDLVARVGGDEFAILQDQKQVGEAERLAGKLIATMAEPFRCGDEYIQLSCSIGIALSPHDGSEVEELLRSADLAMYQAKSEGNSAFRVFVPDLDERIGRLKRIRADLRGAIANDEFLLYYQPQVSLATGRVVGVEALLRWNRPEHGFTLPGEFLGVARENGLIGLIDEWVLARACTEAAAWQARGLPPIQVGVNLSPTDLQNRDMIQIVTDVLVRTGLDPRLLELELTEGELMRDMDNAASVLTALRQLGVRIAIDDFGIGYSSLSYVKNFPVDRLKIDQCFVRDLGCASQDTAIVRAIITLGHSLGMSVMAEGIENVTQLSILMNEGCDEIQGFYFSAPVPAEEIEQILLREKVLIAPVDIIR